MTRVEEIRARLGYAKRAFSWLGSAGVAMDDVTYLLDVAAAAEELLEMHVGGATCLHHERLIAALNRAPSSRAPADGARVRATEPPHPFVAPPPQPGGTQRIDRGPVPWRRSRPW